jgi:hypothetical protein
MPHRARLSIYETQRLSSRGMPVSVAVMDLTIPNPDGRTERHYFFPVVSGGFGRGPAPGLQEDLPSANGAHFPGTSDVRAVYRIGPYTRHKGETGVTVTGKGRFADFFLRLISPRDARGSDGQLRGRSQAEFDRGIVQNSLAIHPDGDSVDIRLPLSGAHTAHHDGKTNDGTNGCFGVSAEFAKKFQTLFEGLPLNERPENLFVIAPPAHFPRATAQRWFPNLVK